jgi:hypothetical protein
MTLSAGTRLGPYEIAAALGAGGMGEVYRAAAMDADDGMTLYNVGCIFSLAGRADEALDCLERPVAAGLTQRGWYEHDSNLDFVRNTPRFQALLARLP